MSAALVTTTPNQNGWVIDRRIPLATIFALVVTVLTQFFLATWWIANLDTRVQHIEKKAMQTDSKLDAVVEQLRRANEHLARIDERTRRQ